MAQNYLMLLWHMHQPFYKDLVEGHYTMPWVRLHGLKDYYGMVAILKEFPAVHLTFNLVPSLVTQLVDYTRQEAQERAYDIAFKPAHKLTPEEKESLLTDGFQLNRENLLNRFDRFRELFEKRQTALSEGAARLFTVRDLCDLQVLSQLAWFDEIYLAGDSEVRGLVAKGRNYTEEDKALLYRKEVEILNAILKEYREASERGQIELSTSPFYHPILPLLCDSSVGAESHPGLKLPHRPFRHPEDARGQLQAAVAYHERVFGRRPRGLWPSEGSVSDEVLRMAAEEGFEWVATDEGVLGRSLETGFYRQSDGTVTGAHELYRPHRFAAGDRAVSIFFRDHQLSDLIGFVYARMDPQAAAADLHQRIQATLRGAGERPAVLSIILDGENAWEFYRGNGREFLKSFYGRVAQDPTLRAVTASEALTLTEPGTLTHIVPGSWINANFDVWIGAEEDNHAWDFLTEARDYFAQNSGKPDLKAEQVELARQELYIAEGSDWCWWYGPEHSSSQDEQFDLLYRAHLSNIYHLLGGSPPDDLALPIKHPKGRAVSVPPTTPIEPLVDGQVTNYFEWLGAGSYSPDYRTVSMHAGARYIEDLYYGSSDRAISLRLDLNVGFLNDHQEFEIRVNINGEPEARLHALVAQGQVRAVEFWKGDTKISPSEIGDQLNVAFARVFELRMDYALIGPASPKSTRFRVSLWSNGLPLQVIPQEDWLTLEPAERQENW
jgi:alpha-amylase/alpha-mannosidase (GH57 family)